MTPPNSKPQTLHTENAHCRDAGRRKAIIIYCQLQSKWLCYQTQRFTQLQTKRMLFLFCGCLRCSSTWKFFCTCLSHWLDPEAQFSQSSKLQIQMWPSPWCKTDSLYVYQWLLSLTDQWRDLIPFVKRCTNITDWQPTSDPPTTMSWWRTSRNDIGIPDGA